MDTATSAAELRAALDFVLAEIAELAGPAGARHFDDAVAGAGPFGEAIAVQHLRNKLVAYLFVKGFPDQPQVGFKPRMKREIAILVDRLENALLRHFEPAGPPAPRSFGHDRAARILLVLDHLPARNRIFSHTRQVCTYAGALALDDGVEAVRVLVTQETAPENPYHAIRELGPEDEAGWRGELEEVAGAPAPKVQFQTVGRVGPVRPYRDSIASALAFEPDLVFAFQGIFRSRMIPLLLHPRAAIIAVQMNQINPEPAFADLVLAHGHSGDFSEKRTPSKWRNHAVPLIPFPKEIAVDPADLGPASPFRIVTVLTLGRLEKGLMRDDAAGLKFVVTFLERHPLAVWLLVAIEDPEAFAHVIAPHVPATVAERIRLLPIVPDLRAIYEHCHVYVHLPPLEGGNMGIAMAVAEGIPVLARKGTDGANTLLPSQAYADAAQAAKSLRRLAASPELRSRRLAKQREKIERDHSLPAATAAFHTFLKDALANFEARRQAGPPNAGPEYPGPPGVHGGAMR
ncbi:MAG: hypothetical protein ABI906_00840 [Pseudomonadota bacterium]